MDTNSYHRPHLLIVDDTPMNIEILLDALDRDYEMAFSTSGQEALQLIADSETPDLILLDVMMPEMDGYEVCRRLKQNPATRDIPIIFVTAMDSSESESTGLALGADDYITKPINLDIARLRIKNVLERTRLGRELELTLACANQGLWEWELASNMVSLDPRWATPLGYVPGELGNHLFTWEKLLHPEDLPKLLAIANAHLNGKIGEISVEIRMRSKDDTFCWMHVLGKGTTRNIDGRPTRMIGTYMDISRRKVDEYVIEAHKNRLATLINSIPDTVLSFDIDGRLADLHIPAAQSSLQCAQSWEQRTYSEIFPKEMADALDAGVAASAKNPKPQTHEFQFAADGETRFYMATVGRLGFEESGYQNKFLAVIRDITQAKLVEDELRFQALHDPLTGLPNRRLLSDRLHQAQLHSARYHSFAALMLLDLNKFKQINDTYGHEIGDKLLIEVAHRLETTLRVNDTVVRLGGDEFVVLVERLGTTEEAASQMAQLVIDKLTDSLRQEYQFGDIHFYCTASIGVKLFQGEEVVLEDILRDADSAMYKMKGMNDG